MKLILLDIDGVLNDHSRYPNGYCGTSWPLVERFNRILAAVPDANIAIISSWRYLALGNHMTTNGIEAMMLTHGVDCHGRTCGYTCSDEDIWGRGRSMDYMKKHGARVRREQIRRFIDSFKPDRYVIIDDLPHLRTKTFNEPIVKPDSKAGLSDADVERAIAILTNS